MTRMTMLLVAISMECVRSGSRRGARVRPAGQARIILMPSRTLRRATARAILAALLFAQAALAIAACDWLVRSPAQVFAAAEAPPCHEAPAKNGNLCLAHCLSDDQSNSTPQLPAGTPPATVFFSLPVAPAGFLPSRSAWFELPPPGPPPNILFVVFRE
jgi:hypothetical protein